jgi:hypothetical protein
MTQTIIQQQPVDGDFDDAVDPESDISGISNAFKTNYKRYVLGACKIL